MEGRLPVILRRGEDVLIQPTATYVHASYLFWVRRVMSNRRWLLMPLQAYFCNCTNWPVWFFFFLFFAFIFISIVIGTCCWDTEKRKIKKTFQQHWREFRLNLLLCNHSCNLRGEDCILNVCITIYSCQIVNWTAQHVCIFVEGM